MRLLRDIRGNTAMIFALCLLPLLVVAGAAIDMTRHRTAAVETQAALDAALLYVAHESGKRADDVLEREARRIFMNEMEGRGVVIETFDIVRDGEVLSARVDAGMTTTLLGLAGIGELNVEKVAEVRFSERKFELALALDTTGSMRGDKIEKLKSASSLLVDKLAAGTGTPENRKFSVVPFATWVNVGPGNWNEEWIDKQGRAEVSASNLLPNTDRMNLYRRLGDTWPGCVEARKHPMDVDDTTPKRSDPDTLFTPGFYPDEPDNRWRYANDYLEDSVFSWNVMTIILDVTKYGLSWIDGDDHDRGKGNDRVKIEKKSNYRYYRDVDTPVGPGFNCSTRPLTPLTTNTNTVKNEIDALEAVGSTNITEGVTWAWRTLSPGRPFTEGAAYTDKNVEKVIILLTDGNNHLNRVYDARGSDYSAYGYLANGRLGLDVGASQGEIFAELDRRTALACENAKRSGITIYAIRLELSGDSRSETLLRNCASSPAHYLDVPDADQLDAAFSDIADDVLDLYLSR